LQPLPDEDAPCGPDLEYDNDFLALNQAVAGKPETQFGPAEPPDWRAARDLSASLLDRSRDLRIAIVWLRAGLHTSGFAFLPVGLSLLVGFIESMWDHVHPMPDADDGDPYPRVNALAVLCEPESVIADLRGVHVVSHRSIGELAVRDIEVALGLMPPRGDAGEAGRDQVMLMMDAAISESPELRVVADAAADRLAALTALLNDKLGQDTAPDLTPLSKVVGAVKTVIPASDGGEEGTAEAEAEAGLAPAADRRGLSGAVTSREEAIRAIDLVCEYLERTEPTNPAPLFLRRARHLIGQNFLQLMKELAPDALADVARVVGVDPDSVQTPGGN
jgi:type VI secretion system protein ImpA